MKKDLFFKLLIAENKQRRIFRKTRAKKDKSRKGEKYDITILKELEQLIKNEKQETIISYLKNGDLVIPLYLTPTWDALQRGDINW